MSGFSTAALRVASALLCLLPAGRLGAQEYRFQFYGVEQGLANLAVKSLYQDRIGFIWVSTENGVFRYDGDRFQSFGREEGIPSSSGAAFGEAPDGSLLIGGDMGLYRLVGNHFEKVPLPGASSVSWKGGVKSDARGRTYIATDSGLMVLTESLPAGTFLIRGFVAPSGVTGPSTSSQGILVAKDGVWYGCGRELCRLSGQQITVYGSQGGLPPAAWMAIGRDANGDLWARGDGAGVAVLAKGAASFERRAAPLPSSGLNGIPDVDAEGRILFPSPDGLVIRRNDDWQKIGRAAGLRGAVYSVMQDRDGSLWIGLAGRGLARWLGYREWEAYTTDSGLGSDLVYEILPRPDGTVWAGTESGLVRGTRHGEALTWQKQSRIGNTPVHSVRSDPEGMLWLGTETRGVGRLNPATGVVDWIGSPQGLEAKSPYTLNIDHHRRIWAATENGLFVAGLPFRHFRRVKELPRTRFWTVVEARNGDVWAGGSSGLFHLVGDSWERFTTREGLSNDEVLSLGTARNGDVWVGYRFGTEIDRMSSVLGKIGITHMAHKQTGGSGLVYFLGFDARERLWAGTERGVDVWGEGRWSHLDTNDGLVWDDCDLNGFAAEPDGTVWIGTSGGLARYSPRPQAVPVHHSAVIFTGLALGKRDTAPTDHPSVDYLSSGLVARYSALNFTHANGLSFRYRLSPLFAEWRTTDRRELEFPGLPPGSYRLEVQFRDQWGAWSAQAAAFSFDIRSPWFRSWWFIGMCILAPLILFAFGIRLRMAVLKRHEEELIHLVEERTTDLKEANEELFRLSSIDGLTGLANRRTFDQTLEREWARLLRTGEPLSLLLLDVDHFKILNDSEGHQCGDECLVRLSSEFRRLVKRETDLVARYGGEEFAIILAATDGADAMRLADGIRLSVAGLGLSNIHSPVASTVTVSIGVATSVRGCFADASEFFAAADHALYAAKRLGRNRVAFSSYSETENRAESLDACLSLG